MMGPPRRDEQASATIAVVERFNAAFNQHDVAAIMASMTDDCVFENTTPPPDGERFEGQVAVRAYWEVFFRSSPTARFETEELFATADHCVVRWRYTWHDAVGGAGHVRGVDLLTIRDGKVAEKRSYVKG